MEETATVDVVVSEQTAQTKAEEQVNLDDNAIEQKMAYAFSDGNIIREENNNDASATEAATVEVLDDKPIAQTTNPFSDFGFETADQLKAELENLRLKASTPQVKDYEFANEESKQIAQIINEGNLSELKKWVDTKVLTSNLDTLGQEEKLKLYLKMQNPKFDNELINDEYKSLYSFDEEDEKYIDADGNKDLIKIRKDKLRLEQRIENDIEKANEYFATKATKVQLPPISVPETTTQNKDYEEYMASIAEANELTEKVIVPKTNSLTAEDLKMSFDINDPNNQMQFRVSITPTKEHLDIAKGGVLKLTDFIRSIAYDEDGNYNPVKAAQFVLKNNYFDDYVKSVARQAVNAERVSKVKEQRNGGGQRDLSVNSELSEVDRMMNYRMS